MENISADYILYTIDKYIDFEYKKTKEYPKDIDKKIIEIFEHHNTSLDEMNDIVDKMLKNKFSIEADDLNSYVIGNDLIPFVAKYTKNVGYSYVYKDPKIVGIIDALNKVKNYIKKSQIIKNR